MTSQLPPASADSPHTHYIRAPHAAWRRIGDETVVLDQKQHRLVALNAVGGELWHRLDVPRRVDDLVSPRVSPDVRSFLEELVQLGLLERTANGDATPRAANDDSADPAFPQDPPAVLWQEPIQNAAQTSACAFVPGQNAICNAVPFS